MKRLVNLTAGMLSVLLFSAFFADSNELSYPPNEPFSVARSHVSSESVDKTELVSIIITGDFDETDHFLIKKRSDDVSPQTGPAAVVSSDPRKQ